MAKRRGNNEGSIYRRKDGYWVGQYRIQTAKGTKTRYIYGKTRAVVAEKLTCAPHHPLYPRDTQQSLKTDRSRRPDPPQLRIFREANEDYIEQPFFIWAISPTITRTG
jgi:hypothetical protein